MFSILLLCLGAAQGNPTAALEQVTPLSIDGARDASRDGLAFVELRADRRAYFVHETALLRLRFGIEDEFLRERMIALFRQPMDVPVQATAPWLEALDGALVLHPARADEGDERPAASFALDDALASARRVDDEIDGERRYRVFEVERAVRFVRPGTLALPAPILRFAFASRFQDDFLNGRTAVDRHDVFVRGAPLVLTIESLPEEGRPAEFTGAVGRISVRAEARVRGADGVRSPRALSLAVGESLELVLEIRGDGDLAHFDPPRLDSLAGFQLLGVIDERDASPRTVTYDLAPRGADVREVPAIPLAFFDPTPPAGYRVVRTEPIPLSVNAGHAGRAPKRRAWIWWACSGVIAVGLVVAGRIRARGLSPLDPEAAEARRAADVVRETAALAVRASETRADPAEETRLRTQLEDDLTAYLAARLRCAPAAVIGPKLAERLAAALVPEPLAKRVSAALDALVAARFGGPVPWNAAHEVSAVVGEIEAACAERDRAR